MLIDGTIPEPDETVILTLSPNAAYTIGSPNPDITIAQQRVIGREESRVGSFRRRANVTERRRNGLIRSIASCH